MSRLRKAGAWGHSPLAVVVRLREAQEDAVGEDVELIAEVVAVRAFEQAAK